MLDSGTPMTLKGKRILIVEDETLISMLFEDILSDFGCDVVGPALNIRQATALANEAGIDVAVLDVNVGGEPIYPVAEILEGRGVPIIFSSGYGSSGLPERWSGHLTLPKPFTSEQVQDILQRVLGV